MQPKRTRIELVDVARGVALVAMAIYHFTWDLDFFGYIAPNTSVTGGWKIFARLIASSFLFLVGVSLFLAHRERFRLRPFLKRLAVIAAAAATITVVTYFVTPEGFIFFGILHHITLASVLGALALRLPIPIILALAVFAIAAPHIVQAPFLDQPVFWWMGLSSNVRPSNDYIPLFPWFGAVLLGLAAAKASARAGLIERLGNLRPTRKVPLLAAAGRHSLVFYLLHQPVLFSLVWLFALMMPPTPDPAQFLQACTGECATHNEEPFCRAYCACVLEEATAAGRLGALYSRQADDETQAWLEDVVFRCSMENYE